MLTALKNFYAKHTTLFKIAIVVLLCVAGVLGGYGLWKWVVGIFGGGSVLLPLFLQNKKREAERRVEDEADAESLRENLKEVSDATKVQNKLHDDVMTEIVDETDAATDAIDNREKTEVKDALSGNDDARNDVLDSLADDFS